MKSELTVKEFADRLQLYFDEIDCRGPGNGFNSHGYDSRVEFWLGDKQLKIKEIEATRHGGCNCWNGMCFEFEEL